jgi:hypothetical protein
VDRTEQTVAGGQLREKSVLAVEKYILTVVLFYFCHRVKVFEALLCVLTLYLLGRPNTQYQINGSEVNVN